MTSAARPTWSAALSTGGGLRDGSSAAPTLQTCAKDQAGHLKLKMRQLGQDAPEEIRKRDLKAELLPKQPVALITGDSDEEIEDKTESGNEKNAVTESEPENIVNEAYSDEEEEDEEDDDEELMRELEKIKKEREAERLARERKEAESNPQAVLAGNPLLASSSASVSAAFGVKRRWDDDVVFKNQARNLEDKPQKRFINDTTRSDFHKRFLDKFIK